MSATKHLSRREALKTLAAAAGAVSLAHLPKRWAAPVIEAGTLPAHAQSSGAELSGSYRVRSLRQLDACENMGMHHIFVRVQDKNGNGLAGIPLKFRLGNGEYDYVIAKTNDSGTASFAMFKGFYWVQVMMGQSEEAGPVTPDYGVDEYCGGDLGNSLYHVSFAIVFEKW